MIANRNGRHVTQTVHDHGITSGAAFAAVRVAWTRRSSSGETSADLAGGGRPPGALAPPRHRDPRQAARAWSLLDRVEDVIVAALESARGQYTHWSRVPSARGGRSRSRPLWHSCGWRGTGRPSGLRACRRKVGRPDRIEVSRPYGTDDKKMDDSDDFAALMHANLIEIFGQRDGTLRREA